MTAALAPSGAHAAQRAGAAAITLTPASGPVGTKTIVTGLAFGTGTSVNVLWNCPSSGCTGATTLATVNTGRSGGFTAIVKVPSAAVGTFAIGAQATAGTFASANFTVNTAPINDDYGNASPLFPLPFSNFKTPENTTSATTASDDPSITNCGAGNGVNGHSVWFSIASSKKATTPTRIIVSTGRSTYATVLAVFSGTRSTMKQVACSAGFQGTQTSKVIFLMQVGMTYHIEITSVGAGAGGMLSIAADVDRIKGAVYASSTSTFTLANANSSTATHTTVQFGSAGDSPLVGDWTGQGFDTVGVMNQTLTPYDSWFLSNSNSSPAANITFQYGLHGDIPIAGDWIGQGFDTIGVYRPSNGTFYLRNGNSNANPDFTFQFGPVGQGALPIVGDWTGQGHDSIGIYIPSTGTFYLRNSLSAGPADITIASGIVNGRPVAGDWTGQGKDTIGVDVNGTFSLFNTNAAGPANITFTLGVAGNLPLAGHWTGTGGI